jgi:hypothetical protein
MASRVHYKNQREILMNDWSIKKILLINALLGIGLISLLGMASLTGSKSINDSVLEMEKIFEIVQTQMHSKGMHASIRSDVQEAINVVQRGDYARLKSIQEATRLHSESLIKDIKLVAEAEADKNPLIAKHALETAAIADKFTKIANTMVSTVASNPELVNSSLPAFDELSDSLQTELESLTAEISNQTAEAKHFAHNRFTT